jgi:RNA polymerase sigma factor (sigma-70 family)
MSDLELLQSYTRENSQPAFAALVDRYLNLVYSAAQRQVRSSQLAEEVAQSVFLDLARNVGRLRPDQPLAPWLFTVTRRTAVDVVRRESRRQAREQTAVEIAAMKTPSPTWLKVKDSLDEAMESLNEAERAALLLRFFENRSLRDVGSQLGISEDTAQKRVSRALERLRTLLLRRGVAISAVGLATDLSAHAVEAAPTALGATIAAATPASGAAAGAAWVKASHTAGATLIKNSALTAAVAAALGLVVVQTQALSRQSSELSARTEQIADARASLQHLHVAQRAAAASLQSAEEARARADHVLPATDPEVERAIEAWLQRLSRLKQLAAGPEFAIPELAALTENEWFIAAREADFTTEEQTRQTFRQFHTTARQALGRALIRGLLIYADTHDGRLPVTILDLSSSLSPKIPAETLERYEILASGRLTDMPKDNWIIAERLGFARPHDGRLFVTKERSGIDALAAP